MVTAILSRGDGWHVQNLLRAANGLAVALDFRTLHTGSLNEFDVVIVRTMPAGSLEQIVFRMDLLHAAEARGTRVINPPRALECCVDKYLTNVRLEVAGLPVPPTRVTQTVDDAMAAFEALGRNVVVKPLFGSEGRGMVRLTDRELAWRTFQTLSHTHSVMYIQQFIHHPGWDVRAFVLNGEVIAAMKRQHATDWRTNVAQGGTATVYELNQRERELAIEASRAVGTIVAGVDLMTDGERDYVTEVNAVPGWRAISEVCRVDVAVRVLDSLNS